MHPSRIALATLVLGSLAAQPALALHKCTTKEGKVIYTEFECEKDAQQSGVVIHDSSGVDTKKGGSPIKSSSGGTAKTSGKAIPPPPPMMAPVKPPPHLNDPNVNAGVRQHAQWQYEQQQKEQAAKQKAAYDEWKEKVKEASK